MLVTSSPPCGGWERPAGGTSGDRHLEASSAAATVRMRSGDLAQTKAAVVASEPMDESPGWRPLRPGELVHVGADLGVRSQVVIDGAPVRPLTLADIDAQSVAAPRAQ